MNKNDTLEVVTVTSTFLSVLNTVWENHLWLPFPSRKKIILHSSVPFHDGDRVRIDLASRKIIGYEYSRHLPFPRSTTSRRYLFYPSVDPNHIYRSSYVLSSQIIFWLISVATIMAGIVVILRWTVSREFPPRPCLHHSSFIDEDKKQKIDVFWGYEDSKACQDYSTVVVPNDRFLFALNIDGHGIPRCRSVIQAALNGLDRKDPQYEQKERILVNLQFHSYLMTTMKSNYSSLIKDCYENVIVQPFIQEMITSEQQDDTSNLLWEARKPAIEGKIRNAIKKINNDWKRRYDEGKEGISPRIVELYVYKQKENDSLLKTPVCLSLPEIFLIEGACLSVVVYDRKFEDCYVAQLGDQYIFVQRDKNSAWESVLQHTVSAALKAIQDNHPQYPDKEHIQNALLREYRNDTQTFRLYGRLEMYKSLGDFELLDSEESRQLLQKASKKPISPEFFHSPDLFYFDKIAHIVMGSDGWESKKLPWKQGQSNKKKSPMIPRDERLLPFFQGDFADLETIDVHTVYTNFMSEFDKKDDMSFVIIKVRKEGLFQERTE